MHNIVKSNHLCLYIYRISLLILLVLPLIVYFFICPYIIIFIFVFHPVCSLFIALHTTLCGVGAYNNYIYTYMITQ